MGEPQALVVIRPAAPADATGLAALAGQLGYPTTAEQGAQRLRSILSQPTHQVFVAEVDGQLAGWVHAYLRDLLVSERHAHIGGLVVSAEHRSRGVGRRLMGAIEAWGAAMGAQFIDLRSNVVRRDAHRFYQSLGYKRVKTSAAHQKAVQADTPTGQRERE